MAWNDVRTVAGSLFAMCALAAALEAVAGDDGAATGFRSVCGAAIALSVLRAVLRAFS